MTLSNRQLYLAEIKISFLIFGNETMYETLDYIHSVIGVLKTKKLEISKGQPLKITEVSIKEIKQCE